VDRVIGVLAVGDGMMNILFQFYDNPTLTVRIGSPLSAGCE
jgi:hypothetical protein